MGRIFKLLLLLLVLGGLALVGYAYLGDMAPRESESRIEVQLPGQPAPAETGTIDAATDPAAPRPGSPDGQ